MPLDAPLASALDWLLAAAPQFDANFAIRVVSRMFHILSAIIIGGGIFYMRAILVESGPDACFASRRAVWAKWVGIATFLLLVSGFFNVFAIFRDAKAAGEKLPVAYHILFTVKLALGLLVMFIAAILAGKTSAADRFRLNMRRWLNIAWNAVIAIVVIGAILRMFHGRTPADDRPSPVPAAETVNG